MKKLIVTIITSLLLVTTGSVFAQGHDSGGDQNRQRHHRGAPGSTVINQLMRAIKRLELTEEQKADTKAIVNAMKAEIRPIMAETKAGQQQLKALIKAEAFDEEAVAIVAEKEGDLTAERVMVTSRALSRILAQLTDEQRAELEAMGAERQEKRREKRAEKRGQLPDEG